MKVYKYKVKDPIYFTDCWTTEFRNGKVKFFIYGKGYKTVSDKKVIEVDEIEMPTLSYVILSEVYSKYGYDVAYDLISNSDYPGAKIMYSGIIAIVGQTMNPADLDFLAGKGFDVRMNCDKLIVFGIYIPDICI